MERSWTLAQSQTPSREFSREGNFKAKGTAAGVSGHSVIVKRVVLPVATEQEIDASLQFDAEQYIPFGMSEVNLDYQVARSIAGQRRSEWKYFSSPQRKTKSRITPM